MILGALTCTTKRQNTPLPDLARRSVLASGVPRDRPLARCRRVRPRAADCRTELPAASS